jgi:MFS family permease
MAIVMTTTSLVLHNHGSSLAAISAAMTTHTIGMFGFSLPMGRLTDRLGKRTVILVGLTIATFGSLLVAFTPYFASITLGAFLVGFGWCGVNVATTVLVVESSDPSEQGQAVGLTDSAASAGTILIPFIAGPMVAIYGLPSTGFLAIALMTAPILLVAAMRETKAASSTTQPRSLDTAGVPSRGD